MKPCGASKIIAIKFLQMLCILTHFYCKIMRSEAKSFLVSSWTGLFSLVIFMDDVVQDSFLTQLYTALVDLCLFQNMQVKI